MAGQRPDQTRTKHNWASVEENGFTRTRPCRDKSRLAKRDAPAQDTGRLQGHLGSFPLFPLLEEKGCIFLSVISLQDKGFKRTRPSRDKPRIAKRDSPAQPAGHKETGRCRLLIRIYVSAYMYMYRIYVYVSAYMCMYPHICITI